MFVIFSKSLQFIEPDLNLIRFGYGHFAEARHCFKKTVPRHIPVFGYNQSGSKWPTSGLVVIVEDGSEGRSFPLHGKQVDIGRTKGSAAYDAERPATVGAIAVAGQLTRPVARAGRSETDACLVRRSRVSGATGMTWPFFRSCERRRRGPSVFQG